MLLLAYHAHADTLSQSDLQVVARALGFFSPTVTGEAIVVIVYAPNDPASRPDAESIAAGFGSGIRNGSLVLRPRLVAVGELAVARGPAEGAAALIAANGAAGEQVMAAARAHQLVCVTANWDEVRAGRCSMAIRSVSKVEIAINHGALAACGVQVAAAFRMMVHEL